MIRRLLHQAMCLLLVAAFPSALAAFFHPKKPEWARVVSDEITVDTAARWEAKVLWIDARPQLQYEKGHVTGALCLNEDRWNEMLPAVLEQWTPDRKTIVYCSSLSCQASHHVAKRLQEEVGLTDVYVLKGGWEARQAEKK